MGKRDFTGGKSPFVDQALISLSSFLLPFFVGILKGGSSSLPLFLLPPKDGIPQLKSPLKTGRQRLCRFANSYFFRKIVLPDPVRHRVSFFSFLKNPTKEFISLFCRFLQGFRSEFITSSSHCFATKKRLFYSPSPKVFLSWKLCGISLFFFPPSPP